MSGWIAWNIPKRLSIFIRIHFRGMVYRVMLPAIHYSGVGRARSDPTKPRPRSGRSCVRHSTPGLPAATLFDVSATYEAVDARSKHFFFSFRECGYCTEDREVHL